MLQKDVLNTKWVLEDICKDIRYNDSSRASASVQMLLPEHCKMHHVLVLPKQADTKLAVQTAIAESDIVHAIKS